MTALDNIVFYDNVKVKTQAWRKAVQEYLEAKRVLKEALAASDAALAKRDEARMVWEEAERAYLKALHE